MLHLSHTSHIHVLNWHLFILLWVFWQRSSPWYQTTACQQYPSLLRCQDLHTCNWTSKACVRLPENKKNTCTARLAPAWITCMARLAPPWIHSITVSWTTSSRKAIHREHPDAHAFESYATNTTGIHTSKKTILKNGFLNSIPVKESISEWKY